MTQRDADQNRTGRRARARADEGGAAGLPPLASRPLTRRRLLQAGLGASGLALLAGCAPASPPREPAGPAAQPPGGGTAPAQGGGQLVFTSGSEPLTLN